MAYTHEIEQELFNDFKDYIDSTAIEHQVLILGEVREDATYPCTFIHPVSIREVPELASEGVYQAEVLISPCTYAPDDQSKSELNELAGDIRSIFMLSEIVSEFNELSNYMSYWQIMLDESTYVEDGKLRYQEMSVKVTFRPSN